MQFKDKLASLLQSLVDSGLDCHYADSRPPGQHSALKDYYYAPESHSAHVEMIFLCSGALYLHVNGVVFPLDRGKAQVFFMNTVHGEHYLRPEQDYELLWLSLTPYSINLHTTGYTQTEGYRQSSFRHSLPAKRMGPLWNCINCPWPRQARFMSLLLDCLEDSLENHADDTRNYQAEVVAALRRYLQTYYANPIKLSDLAAMHHYSVGHLCSLFRSATGSSIYDFLAQVRLNQAAKLLLSGRYRVGEVAAALGFSDQLYFSRYFKNKFGVSPSKYREKIEEESS